MDIFIKISTEESLSLEEANELLRQSKTQNLDPKDLALQYLRAGILQGKGTSNREEAHP